MQKGNHAGVQSILLLSAIDMLCAALTAAIGLLIVLLGTSHFNSDVRDLGDAGKGFSFYILDVYARAGPVSPVTCGDDSGPPIEPIYSLRGTEWEQQLLSDIGPARQLSRWSFSKKAKETIVCLSNVVEPVVAHLEIFSPKGTIRAVEIRCSDKIQGHAAFVYDLKNDNILSICGGKSEP